MTRPTCDICNRPSVWCDGTYAYCEYHAPIPPTRAELLDIAAAPPWVIGGPVELPPCVVGEDSAEWNV